MRWLDFPRLHELEDFRAQMYKLFSDFDARHVGGHRLAWPPLVQHDVGESYVVEAEVSGLTQEQIKLSVTADTMTLAGVRTTTVPKGYSVHRQERPSLEFSRCISFDTPVDAGSVTATVKDGLLRIHLPKVAEARPRSIAITAG